MENSINFSALPNSSPNNIPDKGTYIGKIEVAEMKQGKDPAKPKYLNIRYGLRTKDGVSAGKFFDIMTNSDHDLVRFKLRRFIEALELGITGDFKLEDLTKVLVGKEIILEITHDTKGENPKAVIDVFSNEIFYPMAEAARVFDSWVVDESSETINAPDADDVIGSDSY